MTEGDDRAESLEAGVPPEDQVATPARWPDEVNIYGIGYALAGVGCLLVSFLALKWLKTGPDPKFSDIHAALSAGLPDASALSKAYFGWLGWVLLVVAGLISLAAGVPSQVRLPLRVLGLLVGFGAGAVTVFAIKLTGSESLSHATRHIATGYLLAVTGFVVIGLGAVAPDFRRRARARSIRDASSHQG